ncbi:MAG TPA: hypothetical protein VFN08_21020 [Gemmatimonadales bacterium]|nr:hypothetical protein [Gemmatimonadales bacterium]
MTGFSPRQQPPSTPAPVAATGRASSTAQADGAPDPWGVRRAENLLTSLEGILSARVVTTPLGEVSEIHILAQAGLQPKQLVRNIESALLAQLGLKVDHRKISIAQTADVKPIEALERDSVRERVLQRTVLFENLSVAPGRRQHRIAISVTLSYRNQTETAEEEASDTPRSRVEGAARAAVTVLDRLLTDSSIALEGAKIVEGFDREFAFVAVQGLGGRDTTLMTGTSEIKESAERAAVFAVLDATNRWTEARRPG